MLECCAFFIADRLSDCLGRGCLLSYDIRKFNPVTHKTLGSNQAAQDRLIATKRVHCISYLRSAVRLFSVHEAKERRVRCGFLTTDRRDISRKKEPGPNVCSGVAFAVFRPLARHETLYRQSKRTHRYDIRKHDHSDGRQRGRHRVF